MRVFISWSGERSKTLAIAMRDWLPLVLYYIEPWLSEADIGAGERWAHSVAQQLSDTNFGIVCVTSENVNSPWLLFEAGALAKSLETSRVVPLLLDLDFSDVTGPLAQFQAKKLTRAGVQETVNSLQSSAPSAVPEERVRRLFDATWPDFETTLAKIVGEVPSQRRSRPQSEVLEELVTIVRTLDARILQPEDSASDPIRDHRSSRNYKTDPGALKDLVTTCDEPDNPIGFLVYGAFFRDEMPWLYELALESYKTLVSGKRIEASSTIKRLATILDNRTSFQLVKLNDPKTLSQMRYEFLRYLQRYEPYLPSQDPTRNDP